MLSLMKLLAILSTSLILVSCAVPPPAAPKGKHSIINAHPEPSATPYMLSFDLEKDYDENLQLKPGTPGVREPIPDLHAYWVHDFNTETELKAYAMKWKQRYLDLKTACGK